MQDEAVRLVVGLGNPGDSYRHHRHNLGFMVVEELARRLGLTFQSGGPSYLVAAGGGQTERIFLLKPLTYMNRVTHVFGVVVRKSLDSSDSSLCKAAVRVH